MTSADVGRQLAEKGFDIDKRRVNLEVIKELGSFEAVVSIHRDINVTIPVHVVRPGGQAVEAEQGADGETNAAPAEVAEAEPATE